MSKPFDQDACVQKEVDKLHPWTQDLLDEKDVAYIRRHLCRPPARVEEKVNE